MLVRLRRIAGEGAVGVASLSLASVALVVSMIAATSPAAPSSVGIQARIGSALDAGEPPGEPIAPLSPEILDVLFGGGSAVQLFGVPVATPSPGPVTSGQPNHEPSPSPSPSSSPGSLPEQITAEPDLRIEMSADRATASPGDTITYTIRIANVGKGTARDLRILSHIPEYTTWIQDESCGDAVNFGENPNSPYGYSVWVCGPPSPGPGEHGVEATTYDRFPPGRTDTLVFKVVVNPDAPQGVILRNHAHARMLNGTARTSNEVSTRVD